MGVKTGLRSIFSQKAFRPKHNGLLAGELSYLAIPQIIAHLPPSPYLAACTPTIA